MDRTNEGWWKSLSPWRRHEIAEIAREWKDERVHRIAAELPPRSPDKSSKHDDPTMEEAYDDKPAPAPIPGFTMAQAHFNVVMAEVEQEE